MIIPDRASDSSVSWGDIQNPPTEYQPSPHSHAASEVIGLVEELETLDSRLDSLSPAASTGSYTDLINVPTTFTPAAHTHLISDVTGLQAGLDSKAPVVHSHSISDVSNLQATLDSKSNSSSLKRVDTYTGTTDVNGNYSVVYGTAFSVTPDIQPQMQAGAFNQSIRITSSATTGFTVNVGQRNTTDILGFEVLLASTSPLSGAAVGVLVTQR